MMKQLAAKADERWKSIPSFLDAPHKQQPAAATSITDSKPEDAGQREVLSAVEGQAEGQEVGRDQRKTGKEKEENPWKKAQRGAPGEDWQPAAWTPGVAQRR